MTKRDPVLHSHVTDVLAEDHPAAFRCLGCKGCGEMLHASNNECMQTWIETGRGDYCVPCFAALKDVEGLDDDWGLPG